VKSFMIFRAIQSGMRWARYAAGIGKRRVACKVQNVDSYHCHYTDTVRVPLSPHRHCSRSTVTTQTLYACHYHYTDTVHVTLTTQTLYTYHCHYTNTVHVPLSLHRHCTRATVTIQTLYTYHCR
jgi:hypothetical protein